MLESTVIQQLVNAFSGPTWEIIAFLFFLATGFFYGISVGIRKMLAVLFSLYISILLYIAFPYTEYANFQTMFAKILIFFVFFSVLVILFSKTIFRSSKKSGKWLSSARWWNVFLLSFLQAGLFMNVVFRFFNAEQFWGFSPIGELFFSRDVMFFWWLVLPLPILLYIVKKPKTE